MEVLQGIGQDTKESVDAAARDVQQGATKMVFEVENYLMADMRPHSAEEAALQSGEIPSNTADAMGAH